MRVVRYKVAGGAARGILRDGRIERVNERLEPTGETAELDEVELLAPTEPSKIICVGLNYRSHAREVGATLPEEPCLFMKPSTAVLNPEGQIVYPPESTRVDYEAELGVVIARTARNLSADEAAQYVLGYTCVNDVTARDLQRKDGQWTRAKSFDTFAPIGPWIETEFDPAAAEVIARLNGETKQQGTTADCVFCALEIVSYVSRVMTLLPGDVIATGTPAGIGPMQPGDTIEVEVSGLGVLRNRVVASPDRRA